MNIYAAETKRLFKPFVLWSAVSMLLLIFFLAFFPSMTNSGMSELVKAKLNAIPPGVRKTLGIDKTTDFSDLLQYFAYITQYILIAACIYSATLGASSLIKEESEGTIEFLYSRPVSRARIVTMKALSAFTILLSYNLLLYAAAAICLQVLKKPGYQYITTLTAIFTSMFWAQLAFLALGFAFSTVLPRQSQAVPAALGIFFVTYILGIFSSVIEKLDWMQYLSPYHYAAPLPLLKANGSLEPAKARIILFILLIGMGFTYWRYRQKDLMVQ